MHYVAFLNMKTIPEKAYRMLSKRLRIVNGKLLIYRPVVVLENGCQPPIWER